jgi:DNA-binding NtrC family response regulator
VGGGARGAAALTSPKPVSTILVVDDNREFAGILSDQLRRRGHEVQVADSGESGLALALTTRPELIFLDLRLTDMSGLEVLNRVRAALPAVHVVIVTAYPEFSSAQAAIRERVDDYLCKPFASEELDAVLGRILPAAVERARAPSAGDGDEPRVEIIGEAPATRELRALLQQLGARNVRAALVTGESGTGKELAARMLHAVGPRRERPFVAVNCAAISETLFESEFFGHERGAFTGAIAARRGFAEMADGGTLFLDEIGEMPKASQPKLLRFLDDQTFLRVGGARKVRVDVQIVAATNRDLREMVEQQTFRQDLYFRLNVATVPVPPLRERRDDILPLARYWLAEANARYGRHVAGFTAPAEARLLAHPWPGNVRELRNLVERLVLLCPGERIGDAELPADFAGAPAPAVPAPPAASLADIERAHILEVLAKVDGNKTKAAEILGISRQTLRTKIGAAEASRNVPAAPTGEPTP